MKTTKILISPGFGAGWSSWFTGTREQTLALLTWAPMVEAVERGETIDKDHPSFQSLLAHLNTNLGYNSDYLYDGGCRDLMVVEVSGRIMIHEHDGSESTQHLGNEANNIYTF